MGKTKDKDENPLLDDRQLRDKCVGITQGKNDMELARDLAEYL